MEKVLFLYFLAVVSSGCACFQQGRALSDARIEKIIEKRIDFYEQSIGKSHTPLLDNSSLCAAARGTACIMPNGDVWPCVSLPLSMGNLREASFKEIWDSSKVRADILAVQRRDAVKCRGCEHAPVCARCMATSYFEHGDFDIPSELDCKNARVWSNARQRWSRDP